MHLPNLKEAKIRSNKEVLYLEANNIKSDKFKNKKYFLKTYGCQMNVHDSEEIKGILVNLGFTETNTLEESDIVVLNTCAIRENAHDKVFGFLGRVKHLKREKNDLIVCIGGCMTQQDSVASLLKEKYPFVNIVFGTHNINDLGKLILDTSNKQEIDVYSIEGNVYEGMDYVRDSKYSAWVNIMYGCDKFCTYCIVPYTRGKQRSRKIEEILKEVKELKEQGYQEITLLGQNVNAYGKDLIEDYDFATLLAKTAEIGIPRIRFVTSHPWDFTDEMIDIIAKYDNKIKERIPNASITTDIIVGFPNETEDDFNETLDVVNICKFDGAFTFIYSPREGTPASKIKDSVDIKIKEKRLQILNEKINEYSLMHNKEYLDKIEKVLITGASEKGINKVCGYTETMKLVNVDGATNDVGKIIDVKITATKSFSLDGKKVIKVNN